ncbi:DUF262 domain-containing HNH endonuclease family protein [Muricauda sp. SCSIO 64092]|uniref:DUF262 domain-containing protein n=1 Tax=Allomuricauda sp. SCSIO 64092 TaxID=2908842 RepID=UPI001FF43F40|nr:DUF262 domain-containing protein [Muricauda sp. SCSIO 64092]UOY07065.1 DUF262 domain-containing HNH endonuclease family protein [Muricauda sp. SCSIO 64092]
MSNSNLLDTKTISFNDIIRNGKIYKVPQFQRDYSWDEDNWEDLWNDILNLNDTSDSHYMGSIVLQDNGDNTYDIIDGQQRFTTLTIIALAVINNIQELANENMEKEDNEERVRLLVKDYIGQKDSVSLKYSSKLFLNENNDGFFQTRLVNFREPVNYNKLNSSEKLLWDAYLFFSNKIESHFAEKKSGQSMANFLNNKIGRRLLFIQITVEDEVNAYTVFETLNSRGVELTSTDLLKNYLFSLVAKSDSDLKIIKTQWKKIIEITGLKEFPIFLRHYLNARRKLISKEYLFKAVKQQLVKDSDVFELLDSLEKVAYFYMALANPYDEFWEGDKDLSNSIGALKLFRVTQNKPLLMIAYEKFGITNEFKKLTKAIVTISFRYNVIGKLQANEMDKVYNKTSINLFQSKTFKLKKVLEDLRPIYISDDSFKSYFELKTLNTSSSSNKKLARYILYNIESQAHNGANYDYLADNGTIEHILPVNFNDSWNDHFSEDDHARNLYKLGNMTLLEVSKNKESSDKPYKDKIEIFNTSKYAITNSINSVDWNVASIKHRQSKMGKIACGRWKISYDNKN